MTTLHPMLAAAERLLDIGDIDAALTSLQQTAAVLKDHARAQDSLADALAAAGDWKGAHAARDVALTCSDADPAYLTFKRALTVPVIVDSKADAEGVVDAVEAGLERVLGGPAAVVDVLALRPPSLFLLPYLLPHDPARLCRLMRKVDAAWRHLFRPLFEPVGGKPASGHKRRVGLLSLHWRDHTIARLFGGLVQGLARAGADVVLLRQSAPVDHVTAELDAQAHNVAILPTDPGDAATMIRGLDLSALYFPDVGMDAMSGILCRLRLAPVQMVGWGHPITTGSPEVDVFLSCAAMESADGAQHYSEALAAADPVFMAPILAPPEAPEAARQALSREGLSFPPDCAVYVCPQSPFKLSPDVDAIFADLLAQDGAARLILLQGQVPAWGQRLKERFAKTFSSDAMSRILFLPPMNDVGFRALLENADVVLDVPGWSGGRTTLEAWAAGAPVVTMPGLTMRACHTAGLIKASGEVALKACVCDDAATYVRTAQAIAHEPSRRAALSRTAKAAYTALNRDHGSHALMSLIQEMANG